FALVQEHWSSGCGTTKHDRVYYGRSSSQSQSSVSRRIDTGRPKPPMVTSSNHHRPQPPHLIVWWWCVIGPRDSEIMIRLLTSWSPAPRILQYRQVSCLTGVVLQ